MLRRSCCPSTSSSSPAAAAGRHDDLHQSLCFCIVGILRRSGCGPPGEERRRSPPAAAGLLFTFLLLKGSSTRYHHHHSESRTLSIITVSSDLEGGEGSAVPSHSLADRYPSLLFLNLLKSSTKLLLVVHAARPRRSGNEGRKAEGFAAVVRSFNRRAVSLSLPSQVDVWPCAATYLCCRKPWLPSGCLTP